MKNSKKLPLILFSSLIFGCSNSHKDKMNEASSSFKNQQEELASTPQQEPLLITSSAAKVDPNSDKKFIRTAHLKFKVDQVSNATYGIESTVSKFSGYVTHTNLQANINYSNNTLIAPDTIEKSIHYTIYNDIIIRIPNSNLDTLLKEMVPYINFLDYRVIDANDVTLDLIDSKLNEQRELQYGERLEKSIEKKGKKLKSIKEVEKNINTTKVKRDEAYLAQLRFNDNINYSTINLHIYQNPSVRKELHIQQITIPYESSLTEQLSSSASFGWKLIIQLFIFLIKYWSILFIVIVIYFLVIHLKRKRLNK